jgi:hypothetical protein
MVSMIRLVKGSSYLWTPPDWMIEDGLVTVPRGQVGIQVIYLQESEWDTDSYLVCPHHEHWNPKHCPEPLEAYPDELANYIAPRDVS